MTTRLSTWALASMWEVNVGLGRAAEAAGWEQAARDLLSPDWMLQSTEEQLLRVRKTQAELALAMAVAPAP